VSETRLTVFYRVKVKFRRERDMLYIYIYIYINMKNYSRKKSRFLFDRWNVILFNLWKIPKQSFKSVDRLNQLKCPSILYNIEIRATVLVRRKVNLFYVISAIISCCFFICFRFETPCAFARDTKAISDTRSEQLFFSNRPKIRWGCFLLFSP